MNILDEKQLTNRNLRTKEGLHCLQKFPLKKIANVHTGHTEH